MTEKLKALWAKLKEHLKKISKKVYIFAGVALVVLAAVVVLVLYNKPYEVLVTGVSSGEASSILSYLDSLGVTDYKVENNDTILVPRGQEAALKGRILMAGYPQTGYAYSTYYDHVGSLSTEAERNNAYLMFLQESMSNTIRTFENVKDATVYISPGEDHGYVLDSGNVVEASATVTVTMDGAAKLSGEQAAAIRNLVSHAVQGLEIDSVAIRDTLGNTYSADASAEAGNDSALKLQLEEEYENKIRTEVLQALMPFFGEDHVRVSVSCVVDISRRTVNSRDVQMPEWAQDGGTITADGQMNILGGIYATSSGKINMTMQDGSYMKGYAGIDDTQTDELHMEMKNANWELSRYDSELSSLKMGTGATVDYTKEGSNLNLYAHDISGNGTFVMKTDVVGGNGDLLTVDTSDGDHKIKVMDQGSAPTTGDEAPLTLVKTGDGNAEFSLNGEENLADIGAWRYGLRRTLANENHEQHPENRTAK